MANTKELRLKIAEEDTTVIKAICKALNALANPKLKNGFNFKFIQDRLSIYVYRARESFPAFEVSLKTSSEVDESLLLTWNALFKECIPSFNYEESSNQFIISLVKPFNGLEPVLELLNMVKIKKLLTISNNLLSITAIGRQITVSVQFTVVRQIESLKIPNFCSKFNYLHSLGLANFVFTVKKLNDKMLLHISIIPPAENDSRFKKYCETLDQFNSISSFAQKE